MVTAAPYMFKYKRMVVPAALVQRADWPLTEGNRSMGRVLVEYDSSTTEQSFYRGPERPVTVMLFSAEVRSWFSDRFAVGDPVGLQLVEPEGGGLPRLRIFSPQNEETQEKVKNTEVVAVRPDWTDHRGLLGYYNPLIGQYVRTPFLALLMAAAQEEAAAQKAARPANPFFVILDEMNLARVEHYFSELLSCMESEQALHLHDDPGVEEGAVEEGIQSRESSAYPAISLWSAPSMSTRQHICLARRCLTAPSRLSSTKSTSLATRAPLNQLGRLTAHFSCRVFEGLPGSGLDRLSPTGRLSANFQQATSARW